MTEAGRGAGGFAVYSKFMPRIRYARGYGIHSPFIYSLIRNVFMKKQIGEDNEPYNEVIKNGADTKAARDTQNFYDFYGFSGFSVNGALTPMPGGNHLYIFTGADVAAVPENNIPIEWEKGNVLCLIPGKSKERKSSCRNIAKAHPGISIDRKTYFLYFNSAPYEKQHYKL